MIAAKEILALVNSYVEKKATLDEFSQAFAELFYDIEKTGDESAVEVAYAIESSLASVTAGVCPESELLSALKSLLPPISVSVVIEKKDQAQFVALGGFTMWWEAEPEKAFASLAHGGIAPLKGFSLGSAPLQILQTSTNPAPIQQVLEAR